MKAQNQKTSALCALTEAYGAIKHANCRPEKVPRQPEEGVGVGAQEAAGTPPPLRPGQPRTQ